MVSFFHLLLALPVLVLFFFKTYISIKNPSTRPPGPTGLPIIGNLHQLDSSNLHLQLWKFSKIYGPLFSLQIGFKPAIVVSTPKLAKDVLKYHDLDVYSRPPSLGQQKLSYSGLDMLFSPYNDCWREIGKICVVYFFSSKRISSFSDVRKFEVKQMIKKIFGHVYSSKITNLSEIIMFGLNAIICRTAFEKRYEDEGPGSMGCLMSHRPCSLPSLFQIIFLSWGGLINSQDHLLILKTLSRLDVFFQEVIDEHLNPNRKKGTEEGDIVDALLKLKKQGRLSIDLTDNHIKAINMNLLVAATDTSAATSVWVMTGLIKNPRVMKKAQEEVRNLYGKKEFIDNDDIQKLVYLKAVIKETLRFYAPAPLVPRETNKSFIIDGFEIQPNTIVYVNVWVIQRDPEAWKDPEEFYPERFLNNDIDFKGQDFELIPFGAGHRICPGIPLATASVELTTANLLNSFDWELPAGMNREDIDTEGLPGLARHKKNHLCIVSKNHM